MPYAFLAKLMVSKKLKFEEGKIIFSGQYMTFFPLLTLKQMTLDAMKKGKTAVQELYFYGWHFGFTFTYSYMKTFKLRPFEETYKLIMDVASLLGFGDYKTFEFRQRKFSRFENIENPFGLLLHPSQKQVCHFIRGMNAGGGTALHKVLMNGIELDCASRNKARCVFVNMTNPLLQKEYADIAGEQLDMVWLKSRQSGVIGQFTSPVRYMKF